MLTIEKNQVIALTSQAIAFYGRGMSFSLISAVYVHEYFKHVYVHD